MKKLLVAGIAVVALHGAPLLAADMPVKGIADPLFNWTGWYGGANVAYSWGRSRVTVTDNGIGGGTVFTQSVRHDGWQASVEGGYCWQQPSAVTVACFEVRYDFPHEKGRTTITVPSGNVIPTTEIDPLLIGPHLGLTTDRNRTLWYAAGGLALGPVGGSATVVDPQNPGTPLSVDPGTKWKAGWFVGLGLERMIDNHWSWKVEYDYVRIGGSGSGPTATIPPGTRFGATSTVGIGGRAYDNVVTFGINYHFGSR